MVVRLSTLRAGRPLPLRKAPGTHFCQRLSRPQRYSAAEGLSTENSNNFIGNRTRDLSTCSTVPQPTTR
jgi:hypothetical protein